jgi:DNA transformation protein
MKSSDQFAAYAVEMLSAVGRVTARRMFGGYGVYCDGAMFALVADDVLYLKVDDGNRGEFERAGAAPFIYDAKGKRTAMSYFRAPDEALESRDLAAPWARSAYAAALRARSAKRAGARPGRRR